PVPTTETFMSRSPYGMPSWPPRTPDGRLQVAVAVVGARLQAAERLLGGGHDLEDRVSQEGALDGLERPVVADVAEQRDGPDPDRLDRVREGPRQPVDPTLALDRPQGLDGPHSLDGVHRPQAREEQLRPHQALEELPDGPCELGVVLHEDVHERVDGRGAHPG